MFTKRSTKSELLDNFSLSGIDLIKNLKSFARFNRFLGGNKVVLTALEEIVKKKDLKCFSLADLGCGGGDILRIVAKWARKKGLNSLLYGIDANPENIKYAVEQSTYYSNIHYQVANLFSNELGSQKFDIVTLSTVCHHFTDNEIIKLLTQLKDQTEISIIINDLHRHFFAYHAIKILTKILPCSYLEKNDGPLSVLKAFKRKELVVLLKAANIKHYQIKWCWAFRYQILIYL